MSLFKQMQAAWWSDDFITGFAALHHDDYVFVSHQSGSNIHKPEWEARMREAYDAGKVPRPHMRLIYENQDIMVVHMVSRFPDGTREAVLVSSLLKDGKIIRTETGATLLDT